MAITTEHLGALRTYLTLDPEAVERSQQAILDAGRSDGFSVLLYAALVTATRRRFGSGWDRADIVRYVADIRTRGLEEAEIDPVAAETILRRALGVNVASIVDEASKASAQVLLLTELIADSDLDEIALSAFLAEARQLADRWLAERAGW
jgi:hypothetical protein